MAWPLVCVATRAARQRSGARRLLPSLPPMIPPSSTPCMPVLSPRRLPCLPPRPAQVPIAYALAGQWYPVGAAIQLCGARRHTDPCYVRLHKHPPEIRRGGDQLLPAARHWCCSCGRVACR